MNDNEFKNASKETLLEGAKLCVSNANNLFESALKISELKNYGIANSLLILSVEECIKAYILTAGFFGVELPFDIKPFFTNHKTKHQQAAEIQPIINMMFEVKDMIDSLLAQKGSMFNFALILSIFSAFSLLKNHEGNERKFTAWWKKANIKKNLGFYVDYQNSKWTSPANISETFKETRQIAEPFVKSLLAINKLKEDNYIPLKRVS